MSALAKSRSIRVTLEPVDRTDLICIGCGLFIGVDPLGRNTTRRPLAYAIAAQGLPVDQCAAVHKSCIPLVKASPRPRASRVA